MKKGLLIFAAVLLLIFVYKQFNRCICKDRISYKDNNINENLNLDSLFLPADSLELARIAREWSAFRLESDSFQVIKEASVMNGRKLIVVAHYAEGRKHYGAILFPRAYNSAQKYPLLLWANGLNQADPTVDLENYPLQHLFRELSDHFIIIPSYRGQALAAFNKRYCSDGFFGDAFDGATDDALRLLHLSQDQFRGIDKNRVAVCGVSRGGTVALLMASRMPTINATVAIAGPTDFFSKKIYHRYGFQYKYQFLSKKLPPMDLRAKMIKSSPGYFIKNYSNALLLIHGKEDKVVPLENAERIMTELQRHENMETRFYEGGHDFHSYNEVISWIKANN